MHRGGPEIGMQVVEHLRKALHRLELSDEQREAIHGEVRGYREGLGPLIKELHAGRAELHGLITSEGYDEEAVAALADRQGEVTAEITRQASGLAATS